MDNEITSVDWKEYFINAIKSNINDEAIKDFALKLVQEVPDYFWHVAASSSGKYHPAGDLGEGGLVRHSVNVMRMLNWLMEPEQCTFTEREKDLLRVAALFHDSRKSGTQEEWEKNEHTKHKHPLYAAVFVGGCSIEYGFPYNDAKFIGEAIISHMGQWNVSKYESGVLPKPETEYQKALHMADYLASRKEININNIE